MKKPYFILPDNTIYLCGHSLGPCTIFAQDAVEKTLHAWKSRGVCAWDQWITLPAQVAKKIAALIGAVPESVTISDSTSVNLFKVLHSAFALNKHRTVLLTDRDNFPSDHYIAQGFLHTQPTLTLEYADYDTLLEAIHDRVGVLLITHVNYRDARKYDLATLVEKAHAMGIIVVVDLSHSVGILPLSMDAWDVDFAVGCTYKYLNGGPGAPSFIYVNKKHHDVCVSPITGWMGHQSPFDFSKDFIPHKNSRQYNVGTPYILSLQALDGALSVFDGVDMQVVREKSLLLTEYLITLVQTHIPTLQCLSPREPDLRAGHVAFLHHEANAVCEALIRHNIVTDARHGNVLRLSPNPLCISQCDIEKTVAMLVALRLCEEPPA